MLLLHLVKSAVPPNLPAPWTNSLKKNSVEDRLIEQAVDEVALCAKPHFVLED
jgi:hypothetical protein